MLQGFRKISESVRKMSCCKVAVCQFTATNNKNDNLQCVKRLVSEASSKDAKIAFLPEGCDYIAATKEEGNALAETLDGVLMNEYKGLAKHHKIWLSIGGFHVKNDNEEKLRNCHVLIDDLGQIRTTYSKMHLFDVEIPEKNLDLKESSYVTRGDQIVPPVTTPAGNIALSICYDLRFPELSTVLRKMGATILTYPSAFTKDTGQAHWEVLLRARAIENQCYVIAAAQYGRHSGTRVSFGQAMIVDPWGTIIAECPKYAPEVDINESVAIATIDSNLIAKIRQDMPVFEHRRNDLYDLSTTTSITHEERSHFMFATNVIPFNQVFLCTDLSFAFTNIRCVVPGHVLVSPIRKAKRLQDLTPEEVADLFKTVIKVQKVVEEAYSAQSSCVCVQDGKDAGQTVPHVHCHILPRKVNDFERNDDIYTELAKHDRDESSPRRADSEMSQEASMLRGILNQS